VIRPTTYRSSTSTPGCGGSLSDVDPASTDTASVVPKGLKNPAWVKSPASAPSATATASSVEGVAVADSATTHDKGGVTRNNDAAAATTFRITAGGGGAATVRNQHVDQREGADSSHECAPALFRRAASRDAAPDHRERAAITEVEAACTSTCPRVHGVAAPDVAIDEPAVCTSHKQDAAACIASAAVDDQRLRHPHSRSNEVPVSRTV